MLHVINRSLILSLLHIIDSTIDAVESGQSISELISHGFDLLTLLLPQSASIEEHRYAISIGV